MKIYFEQRGGLAGIVRKLVVDTGLPAFSNDTAKLQSLVKNSNFFGLAATSESGPPPKGAADYFTYNITVVSDEGKTHTVSTTDFTKSEELTQLISYLRNKLKTQQSSGS
jgi:hypothetical protein